jgi:hypothetical protein
MQRGLDSVNCAGGLSKKEKLKFAANIVMRLAEKGMYD